MAEQTRTAHDEETAGAAVLEDIDALRRRLMTLERERDEHLALLQRVQADFANYQKRVQREMAEERRYAHAAFARELLPVLDNVQRALDAAPPERKADPLVPGVSLVLTQLLDILRRFGVTPIEAQGRRFDPMLHDAVVREPRADVPPGTVLGVFEPGYRVYDRVLRPAKVVVAAAAP